jgi:hypothetical protein
MMVGELLPETGPDISLSYPSRILMLDDQLQVLGVVLVHVVQYVPQLFLDEVFQAQMILSLGTYARAQMYQINCCSLM